MIPIKLQLNNFMSYGSNSKPLIFEGIDLACLSGNNGAGKSSLLESITWALWGKTRAKSDDDLVRTGESGMWVEFEFDLEGKRYKVIRRRSKLGKGKSSLEFQVLQEGGEWISLSESTKVETQKKIIDILRMNYDTFINSAFIRQGRADEFTIKKPAERKEILGEILGLSYYDKLEEKAREISRHKDIENESLKSQIEAVKEEIRLKDNYQKAVKKIEEKVSKSSKEIAMKEKKVIELQKRKSDLEVKSKEAAQLDDKIEELNQDLKELEAQKNRHREVIELCKKIMDKREEIKEGYVKFEKAREEYEKWNQKGDRIRDLTIQKIEIENKISKEREDIITEMRSLESRIKENRQKLKSRESLEKELVQIQKQVIDFENLERKEGELENKVKNLSRNLVELEVSNRQIKESGKELKKRIVAIKKAEAICPLCEQSLEGDYRKNLEKRLFSEVKEKISLYNNNNDKISEIKKVINLSKKTILDIKNKLKEKTKVDKRQAEIEKDLREIENISKELSGSEKKYIILKNRIEKGEFGEEDMQKKLAEIQKEIVEVGYNKNKHLEVRNNVNKYRKYEDLNSKLKYSEERYTETRKAKDSTEELISKKQVSLENVRKRLSNLGKEIKGLDVISSELDKQNQELLILRKEYSSEQTEYGAIKEKLDRVIKLERDLQEKKKRLNEVVNEKTIYDELALAFSKNGIQAMIIENVIPEIEDEANKILSRMTDNKMSVSFETQRQKKTEEGIIETLDIKIKDELGEKSYEMYSGGESFRINFAIRVALSKLLAHRAGAKLQFLVIDEGFGTQDLLGREKLVEAINSIKEDFEKILVITHIQELKDVFPIRIEVTKDENGSKFEVIS